MEGFWRHCRARQARKEFCPRRADGGSCGALSPQDDACFVAPLAGRSLRESEGGWDQESGRRRPCSGRSFCPSCALYAEVGCQNDGRVMCMCMKNPLPQAASAFAAKRMDRHGADEIFLYFFRVFLFFCTSLLYSIHLFLQKGTCIVRLCEGPSYFSFTVWFFPSRFGVASARTSADTCLMLV